MRGAVIYAPGDVRLEDRPAPEIINPADAVIKVAATCVCGSDLWDYRGINPVAQPTPMGHEYAGVVQEVGAEVTAVKPGQFVIGSFSAPLRVADLGGVRLTGQDADRPRRTSGTPAGAATG